VQCGAAKRAGRLEAELERLGRIQLLIVDEVGYIPFDPEGGALFFALISSRYERRSLVVNSNKTFSAWAEIFGDPVAVAAMVDRLIHHAEVIVLRGDSYRLKGNGKEVLQPEGPREASSFRPAQTVEFSTGVDTLPRWGRGFESRRPLQKWPQGPTRLLGARPRGAPFATDQQRDPTENLQPSPRPAEAAIFRKGSSGPSSGLGASLDRSTNRSETRTGGSGRHHV
jgi:hypothetical protein